MTPIARRCLLPLATALLLLPGCGGGGGDSPPTLSGCKTVPAAPTGLIATNVMATSLLLAFTATTPSGCTLSYDVSANGSVVAPGATASPVAITGLAAGQAYELTVTATDAAGTSTASAALSVTTSSGGTIAHGITLSGRMIWHSYDSYGFTGVQSWMADFDAGMVREITPARLAGAMNYHFSPDGQRVVVMADDNDATMVSGTTAWDIFVADVTATGLANITKLTNGQVDGSRNEDPKFSSDGQVIIFKRNLNEIVAIHMMNLLVNGTDQAPTLTPLLTNTTEIGMPYFLVGSTTDFLYADDVMNAVGCFCGGTPGLLYSVGSKGYYPIAIDGVNFYFTGGQGADAIYRGDTAATPAVRAAFITDALLTYEFADPYPLGNDWLVHTSTRSGGGGGGYDLWIGNFTSGETYPLTDWIAGANRSNSDLGPTFHGTLQGP